MINSPHFALIFAGSNAVAIDIATGEDTPAIYLGVGRRDDGGVFPRHRIRLASAKKLVAALERAIAAAEAQPRPQAPPPTVRAHLEPAKPPGVPLGQKRAQP